MLYVILCIIFYKSLRQIIIQNIVRLEAMERITNRSLAKAFFQIVLLRFEHEPMEASDFCAFGRCFFDSCLDSYQGDRHDIISNKNIRRKHL